MKNSLKILAAALSAAAVISCAGVSASADSLKNVDGTMYRYSDSGEKIGRFTGWAKLKDGSRCYYLYGSRLTGWQIIDGKYCHFDENGVASTGKTKIGGCTYYFSNNGEWTGKRSKAGARPADFSITYTAGYAMEIAADINYSSSDKSLEKLIRRIYPAAPEYADAELKLSNREMQIIWSIICEGGLVDSKTVYYKDDYIIDVLKAVFDNKDDIEISGIEPCWSYSISFTANGKTKTVKSNEDININNIIKYDKAAFALYNLDRFLNTKIRNSESYKALPPSEIYYL